MIPWDRPVTRRDIFRYGGTLGFGTVGASILASCAPVGEFAYSGGPGPAPVPPAAAKYVVMVIMDGCRADYLEQGLDLPNFEALTRAGTKYANAWVGSMESITPACHACIGTGRFAKNNGGILGFYWEDPSTRQYTEHVNLTNSISQGQPGSEYAVDPTTLEEILRQNNIPTMASLLKGTDPTAKVYAGAGVKFYAADAAGGPDADFMTYYWNYGGNYYRPVNVPGHKPIPEDIRADPKLAANDYTNMNYGRAKRKGESYIAPAPGEQDGLVIDLARRVIVRERPRLVILNIGEQDFPFGHLNGGILSPRWWKAVMTQADVSLGRLMDTYRELGIFDETVFMFLGDHGMVPTYQQVDKDPIKQAIASSGVQVLPNATGNGFSGDFHTGGFIWLVDPKFAYRIARFLDDAIVAANLTAVLGVYFRSDAGPRARYYPSTYTAANLTPDVDRAYRYLLETLNGPNAPHVVIIYPEWTGTLGSGGFITNRDGRQLPLQWFGDHGGASWQSHHIPLIMSGPGIRSGQVSPFPARLVDLAPTALRLMGVPFPALDGIVLADALATPMASERSAQRIMATQLTPLVTAMKRQSASDMKAVGQHAYNPPTGKAGAAHNGAGNGVY